MMMWITFLGINIWYRIVSYAWFHYCHHHHLYPLSIIIVFVKVNESWNFIEHGRISFNILCNTDLHQLTFINLNRWNENAEINTKLTCTYTLHTHTPERVSMKCFDMKTHLHVYNAQNMHFNIFIGMLFNLFGAYIKLLCNSRKCVCET